MRLRYHARRLRDTATAARLVRAAEERERWPRERLREHQQRALDTLVRHAARNSAFHAERLAGPVASRSVALDQLPIMTKAETMERFDTVVCDPRLRRDELAQFLEHFERDDLYLGRYRVMATSGSSGRKGIFVYDAHGWRAIGAQWLRFTDSLGARPRLPRRVRMAIIIGASPTHMSRQGGATLDVGLLRMLRLPATQPLDQMVDALNRFRPEIVGGYPTVMVRLAAEQLAGRLRLAPTSVGVTSELCTDEMRDRIADAFGVVPRNLYATTEGLWGGTCDHGGLHLYEDWTIVENVDDDGRPVPPGERGSRLLVTNLANHVQPIIRMEISDVAILDDEPCPCGRTLTRMRSIEGRADDVIELPGHAGAPVPVHPLHFAMVTRDREVREFQIRQEGDRIRVLVVAAENAGPELEARVKAAVFGQLASAGVREPRVAVERRAELDRGASGKLQLVVADRAAAGALR